ncbi:MAG: immunoglobulin domain-containing protein, partial [Verrucomicrobiota bacterium]
MTLVSVPSNSPSLRSWRLFSLIAAVCGLAGPSARAQPFTVGPVNTANREEVRTLFNSVYLPGEGPVVLQWTGSIANCDPGTISQSVKDRAQQRVNYFRAMAGVPGAVTFTPANDALAQAGALVNSANRITSHGPPPTSSCYSEQARQGAASDLIGQSNNQGLGPKAIDTWMDDGSFNNEPVGHRRSIINPYDKTMGYGDVPATGGGVAPTGYPSTAALYVFGERYPERPAPRDEFVAWPPKGYLPYQLYVSRWHFSLWQANFDNATVTLSQNGANIPLTIQYRNSGIGAESITFIRTDEVDRVIRMPAPATDQTYTVTVNNVMVNGTARNFTYTVTFFDPAVPAADYTPAVVTGPDRPPLNQNSTYNFNPIATANGYQWRSTKLTPLNLTDGAEVGLANFTPVVTTYDPITTATKAAGNAGFRLRRTGNSSEEQSLTFKKSLLANANSQITFKSRLMRTLSYMSAVQVSLDGGSSWRIASGQPATGDSEAAFSDRVVSLAPYADRQIQVRFALVNTGGPYATEETAAWYFDEVTFVNVQEITTPVINTAAGTTFTFNPSEAAEFSLDVRPQVFGQYYGEWGQAKRVSTIAIPDPVTPVAPTIATQPQGQTVNPGANVTLSVTANGTAPLAYLWKRNGADLTDGNGVQGSRAATLSLANVQAAAAGTYTVTISNGTGNVTSTPAALVINEPPSLGTALDITGLTVTSAGDANWTSQTAVTHDNVDAAQSGRINDNQESRMEVAVNGPATVAFWWRVDSERDYDYLRVDLDGTLQSRISGSVNW